jgi:hypothetical protein
VTVEALMVAHSHSGGHGFSGFGHVHASVDAHSGMPDHGHVESSTAADGVDTHKRSLRSEDVFFKALEQAENDPLRRVYGVHVLSHGYLDLPRTFTEMATKLGAIRVCGTTGNFNPIDISLNDLTDWSKFSPPYSRRRPPAGWYAKANGITHVWRQYWQVGKKLPWWRRPVKGRQIYDRSQSTYLEVNIVTWFFADIGDYETRIDLKIVSLPVLDQYDKQWAIKSKPLKAHQELSAKLADGLLDALKWAKPTEWAHKRRAKLILLQTTRPEEVEKSGADLDSLFANYSDENLLRMHGQPPAPVATDAPVVTNVPVPPPVQTTPPSLVTAPPVLTGNKVPVKLEIPPPVIRNKS